MSNAIQIIRNYTTEELEVCIDRYDGSGKPTATIVAPDGEHVRTIPLLGPRTVISVREFLYRDLSVRVTHQSSSVQYAL